ncbi:MAG: hypothetical protein K6F75_10865 [Butyrivibrio sp.]|nr:hypothetical protein [Butyrivibrio sp.]
MTLEAYTNPDFTWLQKLLFLGMALLGLAICLFLIYGGVTMFAKGGSRRQRKEYSHERFHYLVHLFYEMLISATSVMSFACAYVVLNHIYSLVRGGNGTGYFRDFATIWEEWKDFILLLLICLSCVLNTILDKFIIPLRRINRDQKAAVRMLAMFYAIIILLYLNIIGDESEYSPVMMYYLGLMVGRFVYFDASFRDFVTAIKNVFLRLPLLILGMTFAGLLCYAGFSLGYLLERNYFIVGIFYTHLFILVAVFIIRISHILELIVKLPKHREEPDDEETLDFD